MEKADKPQSKQHKQQSRGEFSFKNRMIISPKPGGICPICGNETLEYNGMLNLVCPKCGLVEGGCFT